MVTVVNSHAGVSTCLCGILLCEIKEVSLEIERKSDGRGSHDLTIGSVIISHDGDSSCFFFRKNITFPQLMVNNDSTSKLILFLYSPLDIYFVSQETQKIGNCSCCIG